jgi:hypothetical protein
MSERLNVAYECKCKKIYEAAKKKEQTIKAKQQMQKQITIAEHFLITETPKHEMKREDIKI